MNRLDGMDPSTVAAMELPDAEKDTAMSFMMEAESKYYKDVGWSEYMDQSTSPSMYHLVAT